MVFEEILGYLLRGAHRMKTGKKRFLLYMAAAFLAMLSVSCVPSRSLVVDIPIPAAKVLPPAVQSFTIVSQAVDANFTDLHTDSLQKKFYQKRFNLDTLIYDVQMADTTMKALGELLFESGRYDYVIPEDRFLKTPVSPKPANELSWDEVVNLTETFNTDAVLSLDYLKARVVTNYKNETYYSNYQGGFTSVARANMRVQYEALFRVYHPETERILLREFIRDTLYWEDTDVSVNALFSRFTPVKQALTESGIVIALDLSEKIAVKWRPERRRYFTGGNRLMRQADQAALNGNWVKAISMWEEAAENAGSNSLKSKAQLNIAVGYEILGDLEMAIAKALESYDTMFRPLTYEYLETMKRRKNELTKAK
jgi:hypothetical protein